jgi:prophage maintenance system killer protein
MILGRPRHLLHHRKAPFHDGNKRTGLLVAESLLDQAGLYIQAEEKEIVDFMLGVAMYCHGLKET